MKSLDELHRIREKAQQDLRIRDGKQRAKVVVAMGTCGIAAGAKNVLNAILDELDKRGIKDVLVVQAGCKGLCSQEPLVDVFRAGEPGVTYGYVTPERARTIVSQHLVNGNIVGEWVVTTAEA
ncbi:MAG: (2Fe-2S) ferredoxin domain-containing protein [Armatimonadota bacterium]|nr:(2Fe-2S) ferredoxin domain-containing protein [Armatimonadota bacterium]